MSKLYGKPNFRLLGKRLGADFGRFAVTIKNLTDEQLLGLDREGTIELDGQTFNKEEIEVLEDK
jgi:isoleucyl-tRNA synthetase